MPYRRPPRRFTPEAIANMHYRYEETDEPQQPVADNFNTFRNTLA